VVVNYLTIPEAAAYYKLSESTVYKLVRTGKIPATKLGHKWMIDQPKTMLDEQQLLLVLRNALSSFGDDIVQTCTLISSTGEVEIRAEEFDYQVNKYAEQLLKSISWSSQEKK
jgi:excisionase family DNA binding protein